MHAQQYAYYPNRNHVTDNVAFSTEQLMYTKRGTPCLPEGRRDVPARPAAGGIMRHRRAIGLSLAVLLLAGCGGSSGRAAAGKIGGSPGPITITVADSQPEDRPSAKDLEHFAAEVEALSAGTITVDVRHDASSAGPADDSPIIAGVIDDSFDIAFVPTRAWAEAGVTSMDVLQAPFEMLSNAHMAAVARDPGLTRQVLAGLEPRGVHGIVLVPEALRYLFSFQRPMTGVADVRGATVKVIGHTIDAAIAALGGTPLIVADPAFGSGVNDGSITAAETDFLRATGGNPQRSTVSVDLPLYAKLLSLVANAEFWDGLEDAQRSILEQAAQRMLDRAIADIVPVDVAAQSFCDAGNAVVIAGDDGLADFRRAVAPVIEGLDADLLAAVRALAPAAAPVYPPPCDGAPEALDPKDIQPDGGTLPNGIYRFEWNAEFIARWIAEHGDAMFPTHDFQVQTITFTLVDGHYTFEITTDGAGLLRATGVYQVVGDKVQFAWVPDVGTGVNTVRWSVGSDGALLMEQVDDRPREPYFGQPWVRVGDA